MVTCCSLCTSLPGLYILGDLYVKYQSVILIYDFVSKMYTTMPSNSWNSSYSFVRIVSRVIILHLARIKFSFLFLIVN